MTKQVVASALGVLLAGAAIIGVAKILGPLPISISQTTTTKMSTFDVSGEGEVTTTPDRAEINGGVQISESTVASAQDKGNQIISKITQDLIQLGINRDDIKTAGYSLYPNYDFRGGSQRITGYSLNVTLKVTIKDFKNINTAIDTMTADGANQVGGVTFTLSEEKRLEIENQAREIAINRAKEKANSLSRISGVRLGKIINIAESTNQAPVPLFARDMAIKTLEAAGGANPVAPTEVSPGSTTFSMAVTLSYETL